MQITTEVITISFFKKGRKADGDVKEGGKMAKGWSSAEQGGWDPSDLRLADVAGAG